MAGHHLRCHQCAPVETKFSMEHALLYTKGEFPSIRHSEICNLTTTLLTEVCHSVCIEAGLQPVSNKTLTGASANCQEGAQLDIAASGLPLREPSSVLGCPTPMPHQTDTLNLCHATENIRK